MDTTEVPDSEAEPQSSPDLLTPTQWCGLLGINILDPDGWRYDHKSWDDPITRDDFMARAAMSTASYEGGFQ